MKTNEVLVDLVFQAIRNENAPAKEKMRAIVRAGDIASLYVNESETVAHAAFGLTGDFLEDDEKSRSVVSTSTS